MKLNKKAVKHFEKEQQEYGTSVAMGNLIWEIASGLLFDIGVTRVKVSYPENKKGRYYLED